MGPAVEFHSIACCHARFKVPFLWQLKKRGGLYRRGRQKEAGTRYRTLQLPDSKSSIKEH
jgi:hypothetical protein